MKDKEMAEERKADYGIDLCCLCRECEIGNIYPCQHKLDAMYGYKDGFLAGLKAGRPQWHEIESKVSSKREISKRYMPKNEERVLLKYHFSGDNEVHISDGYYDAYDFEFHIANNTKHRIVCVIAWCEIPTFEKE